MGEDRCVCCGEIIPEGIRAQYGILPAERAYYAIHEPASMEEAEMAKKRLIFEEFFVFSAGLSLLRASRGSKQTPPYTNCNLQPFHAALPFLLAFAAGAMIYVVVEELIPQGSEGGSHGGTVFFGVGFSVMMLLDVLLG